MAPTPTDLYCDRSDVARRLPLGSFGSSSGIAASSSVGSDVIVLDGHGLETGDPVRVRAPDTGSLAAPLAADTTYYAIRVSHSEFRLSLTPGGAAVDLTTAGLDMVIAREPDFDATIEFYSRWADTFLPAHAVPLTAPVPALVRGLVADLAAKRILNAGGQDSAKMTEHELAAKAQLERFAAGLPVRDARATRPTNLAISSPLPSVGDPRGWGLRSLP